MNKFEQLIADNGSATLKRRGQTLSKAAEFVQNAVVTEIEKKANVLEIEIMNLIDMAPETTDSLRPGSKNWNPDVWAQTLQKKNWELALVKQQLEIARKTQQEYFTDLDTTTAKKA